jgi:hypothetical protein
VFYGFRNRKAGLPSTAEESKVIYFAGFRFGNKKLSPDRREIFAAFWAVKIVFKTVIAAFWAEHNILLFYLEPSSGQLLGSSDKRYRYNLVLILTDIFR